MRTIPELQEGTHRAKASGTLPNGKPVVVNADGTVSVVAASGGPPSVGSPVVFETADAYFMGSSYDPINNKVVIAYADGGNSNRPTAVVGSVSGDSISFGTAVVITTQTSLDTGAVSIVFDSNAEKVILAFHLSSANDGSAIVGTISGTSISFGTLVDFDTNGGDEPSLAFDSSNNKIVVVYRDSGTSSYGKARVGTVSGTSISFGSEVVFASAYTGWPSVTFDSNSNKIVIAYYNSTTTGAAIVGTVSGTSISFGTAVNFITGGSAQYNKIVFDSANNKVVIAFNNSADSYSANAVVGTVSGTSITFGGVTTFSSGNSIIQSATFDSSNNLVVCTYRGSASSYYGTVAAGTVSGTSITFGTPIVYNTNNTQYSSIVFDSSSNQNIISYRDGGNSNYGTALVYSSSSSTLTSENYIGMSQGGSVADGSSATVDIIGSLSTNQSGLTAGQSYYVQTDGTIGETADDPSVFAGTAISATSLVVKT